MTDIENAIACITRQVESLEQELSTLKTEEYIQAYKFDIANKKLAIEALTEKLNRLENPPLTVEEMKQLFDKPIFFINSDKSIYEWKILDYISYVGSNTEIHFTDGSKINIEAIEKNIIKAYRNKPKARGKNERDFI